MSFLNPAALLLLFSLPLIILLHLFKAARREVSVAAVRFWRNDTEDQSIAIRLSQKVRWSSSLLLQLMATLLMSLAVSQPVLNATGEGWPRTILIIDNSASMAATDAPRDRLTAARAEVERFISQLGEGQEATIIKAARLPSTTVRFTADKRELTEGLRRIETFAGVADIEGALRLAGQLARDGPPAEIRLFTDGAYAPPPLPDASVPVQWHLVGNASNNVGITAFEIRKNAGVDTNYQAFVTVDNVAATLKKLTLNLSLGGRVFHREDLELPAKLKRSYIIPFQFEGGGVVRAEIEPDDNLSLDNVTYSVLPNPRNRKVLLVSPGNFFLESALRADPDLEVISLRPQQFSPESAKADVIVLDRVSVSNVPPGNYLLINSLPGNVPIQATKIVELPWVANWNASHPISQYLDFSNLFIKRAQGVRAQGDCADIVEAEQTPLVMACTGAGRRIVFIGFDLLQSEIPLRAVLPILMANSINWLTNASLGNNPQHLRAGERFATETDRDVTSAEVMRPDGQTIVVPVKNGLLSFDETTRGGLYTVELGSKQLYFAVDLLVEAETNITPGRAIESRQAASKVKPPNYSYQRELWWDFVLLALVAVAAELAWVLCRESAPPSAAALLLRGVTLLALGIALARPTVAIFSDSTNLAFVIDVSDSIAPSQKVAALKAVERAVQGKGPHDNVEVVTFADEAQRILTANAEEPKALALDVGGKWSDIGGAILFALAILSRQGDSRIVLLTDGNENRRDAVDAALLSGREGVPIYPVPVGTPNQREVLLEKLVLPSEVHAGEGFAVKIIIWSTGQANAELELLRDGQSIASASVTLKDGKNVYTHPDSSEKEGIHVYEARITSSNDSKQENNTVMDALTVRGKSRVLYVDVELGDARNLIEVLLEQQFEVDAISPDKFLSIAGRLDQYDTVILGDAPAANLTKAGMEHLRRFVKEEGGGLIMFGGDKSFGPGGYDGTPIEEILPIHTAPRAKVEIPSEAIVLVIDRSGSMSTEQGQHSRLDLAKQAAQQSIEILTEKTLVGVLAFDTEADWIVPLQFAKNKQSMTRDISTLEAGGGGTEILAALEEAYRVLKGHDAMLKHIVILSDGEAPEKNFKELLAKVTRDNITVSSIAISSQAGQDLLQKVAKWGAGRYYFTEDLYEIPRILTGETQLAGNRGMIEEPFRPSIARKFNEILRGVNWSQAPSLHGYVVTTLKPLAQALLLSPRDDPILAVWQGGLGRTAAFTSDLKGRWGKEWLGWHELGKFVGQLVRWTSRSRAENIASHLSFEGKQGILSVDVTDDDHHYVNFLEGQAGVIYPDKSRVVVPLTQSAPGQYAATFPTKEQGIYVVGVSLNSGDKQWIRSTVNIATISASVEHQRLKLDMPMLLRLAEISGGRVLNAPEEIFRIKGTSQRRIQVWTWLVVTALLAMITGIAMRRLSRRRGVGSRPQELE